MKRLFTSLLGLSALVAMASTPLPKGSPNPEGGLREINPQKLQATKTPAKSQRVSSTDVLTLPASYDLSEVAMAAYTKVDGNGDGTKWVYEKDYSLGDCAYYEESFNGNSDDWLILPFVTYPSASNSYSLSYNMKLLGVNYPEFEICISPTTDIADAISIHKFSADASNYTTSFKQYSVDFNVPSAGNYCMMLHVKRQETGFFMLYMNGMQISGVESEAFTVPFSMVPEASEARYFTVVDNNNDGVTFTYDSSNSGFSYTHDATVKNPADDYLIFPEIMIDEPGNYKLVWNPRGWGTTFVESLEVLLGQGDDLSNYDVVFKDPLINGATLYPREVVVNIPEAGLWRPALHCVSIANQYKLLVKDFSLKATDEQPAKSLPYTQECSLNVTAANPGISQAFILPSAQRIKVEFGHQGAAVSVGLGNAPTLDAAKELFTVDASTTNVEELFSSPGDGIYYLVISSSGQATIDNLKLSVYSPEDDAYQLPFSMKPTEEQFSEFIVVNSNNDSSTWNYTTDFDGAVKYNYSNTQKANDWLIFPAVNVPSTDYMLNFSGQIRGMGTAFPETFEIWEGSSTDINEMRMLYASPEIRNEAFEDFGISFAPTHSGLTFIAIRATSEPKSFHIFMKNFKLEVDSRSVNVPVPAADLTAEGLPQGSEDARVTFTMPTLAESGATLDASTALTAVVSTSKDSKTLTGAPGQSMECTITNGQGSGTVSVVVSNEQGASNAVAATVYTGQHQPDYVTDINITVDETNRVATLTWNLSDTGVDGGYLDPQKATFIIKHSVGGSGYNRLAETKEGVFTYTYSIPESYPLQMHYFTVTASNVAGEGPAPKSGTGVVMGKPHTIPATDDLSSGTIELGPLGMSYPDETYTLDWYFDNPAYGFDEAVNQSGLALIAFTENPGAARGRLHLPKFDTRTDNGARVVLRVFNYPHFAPTTVFANTYDKQGVRIGSIAPAMEPGWVEYSLPLPEELMNKQWVEIYIDFGFDGTHDDEIWMLDRFGMENYYTTELDLRPVTTHYRVKANEKNEWEFSVGNYGAKAFTFEVPTLNFTTLDGVVEQYNAVSPVETELTLQPGETLNLRYEPMPDTSMEGDGTYDITILVDGDGNLSNNSLADLINVWLQEEFVVRDLRATRGEEADANTVTLTWSEPDNDWGILYVDNLESWDCDTQLGLFKNYDGDKLPQLMFVGQTFPGMGYPKAWQVFDYAAAGFDYWYAGYFGTAKSLIAFCPGDDISKADDWLISPEVKGGTDVDFEIRMLRFGYGSETVEVLYSTTGDAPEDFKLLATYKTEDKGDPQQIPYWEHVNAKLPADARYFAIRYVSAGIFGLQLDDVIYTPAQGQTQNEDEDIVKDELTYTILRDGEPIATGVKGTSFNENYQGAASYHVAAEKAYGGLHPLSNRASVAVSSVNGVMAPSAIIVTTAQGTLTVKGGEGKALSIVTADGKTVYSTSNASANVTVNLNSGLYIVSTPGETPVKALVK